jgi:hypothetical protein
VNGNKIEYFAEPSALPQSAKPIRKKRSTGNGEALAKLISALSEHHGYRQDGPLNSEPIGVKELARKADVSSGAASKLFKTKFGSHAKYRGFFCRQQQSLLRALKQLNGEYAPREFAKDLANLADPQSTEKDS